jgi:hypothetical protein
LEDQEYYLEFESALVDPMKQIAYKELEPSLNFDYNLHIQKIIALGNIKRELNGSHK